MMEIDESIPFETRAVHFEIRAGSPQDAPEGQEGKHLQRRRDESDRKNEKASSVSRGISRQTKPGKTMSAESSRTSDLSAREENDYVYSADKILFPDRYDRDSLSGDSILWAEGYNFELREKYWPGEGSLNFPYEEGVYYDGRESEQTVLSSGLSEKHYSLERLKKLQRERELSVAVAQEPRRRSLFVHSSPTHFPDVNKARKSAFGSVFLRTTAHVLEDAALLQTVANSSYSMLQSLLSSFDKIISSPSSDYDRKNLTLNYKESLLRALETYGISRTYSDGGIHWNIYPLTHNFLFSLQLGDQLHQTRYLSRVEERLLTGLTQKLRLPYEWPTDSVWTGHWDSMGMAGVGTYNMPHGVSYNGKMVDGMCHDNDAMLTYPNQFKALHCVYEKGVLLDCQFQFPDLLMHEKENWNYCQFPDRRFWSEVRRGLKPAKIAQKTERDPPRNVPAGFYDTSDGFYDPVSLMLINPCGELLRVPVCEEDQWIKKYCRKGFHVYTDYRPDLFENWFNYDTALINSILRKQALYRNRKITYDDLQQFYADLGLLPPWSKFQKTKTESQIALEKFLQSIPPPKKIKKTEKSPTYWEHKIPSTFISEVKQSSLQHDESPLGTNKISKSGLKVNESRARILAAKSSKILSSRVLSSSSSSSEGRKPPSRKVVRQIPEKFMRHQPLLRPPFTSTDSLGPRDPFPGRKKCMRHSYSASWSGSFPEYPGEIDCLTVRKMHLRKFMKTIIMDAVTKILEEERQREIKRLKWAQKPPSKPRDRHQSMSNSEKCMEILQELYQSIPEVDEYCDSFADKMWNLKDWAEDKLQMVHYWGTRIYELDFDETDDKHK